MVTLVVMKGQGSLSIVIVLGVEKILFSPCLNWTMNTVEGLLS